MLFGLLPWESTALAWAAAALAAVITVFGRPLQWPTWVMDISPFTQIPKLPGGTVSTEPHRRLRELRGRPRGPAS
jgi:ABC-2 type transport system permease protein